MANAFGGPGNRIPHPGPALILSLYSWICIGIIVAAIAVALSRRFLASGCLMIANGAVFVLTLVSPQELNNVYWTGVPAIGAGVAPLVQSELSLWTPNLMDGITTVGLAQGFTSMFVHHDFFHIFGNLLVLWAFGVPFEERIGARKFVAIYLVGGAVGTLAQAYVAPHAELMGASGAIFAILAAFATKFPRQVIRVPVPLGFFMMFFPMPVVVGALVYLGLQVVHLFALGGDTTGSNVGYFAHIGGAIGGVAMALFIRKASGLRNERVAVDLPKLAVFAKDDQTRSVLKHMKDNHDEPEVFQAWLDRFFRTATCPTCTHRIMPASRGHVICTQGHKFDVRIGSPSILMPVDPPAPPPPPSPPPAQPPPSHPPGR